MGNDKTPLTSEKKFVYEGIYDLKGTYSYIKSFLENSRQYDLTEREIEESSNNGKRKLSTKIEAEQEFNDYFKVVLKFMMVFEGQEIILEDASGKSHKLVNGTAKIVVNSYVEKDFMHKRPKEGMGAFLAKVYDKFFGKEDFEKVAISASKDVGELLAKFKLQVNSEVK